MHVSIITLDGQDINYHKVNTVVSMTPENGYNNWNEDRPTLTATVFINLNNVAAYSISPDKPNESFNVNDLELDDEEDEDED